MDEPQKHQNTWVPAFAGMSGDGGLTHRPVLDSWAKPGVDELQDEGALRIGLGLSRAAKTGMTAVGVLWRMVRCLPASDPMVGREPAKSGRQTRPRGVHGGGCPDGRLRNGNTQNPLIPAKAGTQAFSVAAFGRGWVAELRDTKTPGSPLSRG